MSPGAASRVAAGFRNLGTERVDLDGDTVTFKSGWTPVFSGWNALGPFGSGELEVDTVVRKIRYRLSLFSLVVRATVTIGVMGLFGWLAHFPGVLFASFLAFDWLWLVSGSLTFGVPKFETFVRRAVSSASNA